MGSQDSFMCLQPRVIGLPQGGPSCCWQRFHKIGFSVSALPHGPGEGSVDATVAGNAAGVREAIRDKRTSVRLAEAGSDLEQMEEGPSGVEEGPSAESLARQAAWTAAQNYGRHDEARLRATLESLTAVKGADHPHTLGAAQHLLMCLVNQRKFEEGLPLARKDFTYFQRNLPGGDDDVGVLTPLSVLVICLNHTGTTNKAEAERLCCKGLDIAQRHLGHEHQQTLEWCMRVASCWDTSGRYAEAEPLYRRCVEFSARLQGVEHNQDTIRYTTTLGKCLIRMERVQEGIQVLRKALELNMRAHGLRHPATIASMNAVAKQLVITRDYEKAERLSRQAMDLSLSVMGPDDPTCTLLCMENLAALLTGMGRAEEALPLCRKVLEVSRAAHGPEHHTALLAMTSLAHVLILLGRHDEGRVLAQGAREACLRVLGPDHPYTRSAGTVLGALDALEGVIGSSGAGQRAAGARPGKSPGGGKGKGLKGRAAR